MTSRDRLFIAVYTATFVLVGFMAGTFWGDYCAEIRVRKQAVAAYVMNWSVNPTNGAMTFTWGSR